MIKPRQPLVFPSYLSGGGSLGSRRGTLEWVVVRKDGRWPWVTQEPPEMEDFGAKLESSTLKYFCEYPIMMLNSGSLIGELR